MGKTGTATRPLSSERNEEVDMDERVVGKLQSDVDHTRSKMARMEIDTREIRSDIQALDNRLSKLTLVVQELKASLRLGFIVLGILQLVVASGAPVAIASALRLVR